MISRRAFLLQSAAFLAAGLLRPGRRAHAFGLDRLEAPAVQKGLIALIIDDIGASPSRLRSFLDIKVPMTFAVLPRLPHTYDLAQEISAEGHEILIHQPMEPINPHIHPGPGALYVGDAADRIVCTLEQNLSGIPGAVGVNNHMGSKFTERQDEMSEALSVIKRRGLFFIDSLTSSRSTAYQTAKRLHMEAAHRDVFLDNIPAEGEILGQLCKLKRHALTHGRAIAIGHPYPETARAISRFQKALDHRNISLVPVSRVL